MCHAVETGKLFLLCMIGNYCKKVGRATCLVAFGIRSVCDLSLKT